ncbi:MAG: hypothetical protein AAFQ73_10075 [Pseudomonadota bacterium]
MTLNSRERRGRFLAIAGGVAVLAAVALALSMIRSPWQERAHRLDLERVSRLDQLADLIDCRYTQTGELPDDLARLAEFVPDPAATASVCARVHRARSNAEVARLCGDCAYDPLGMNNYRLCADFATDATEAEDGPYRLRPSGRRDWRHGAGSQCFELAAPDE